MTIDPDFEEKINWLNEQEIKSIDQVLDHLDIINTIKWLHSINGGNIKIKDLAKTEFIEYYSKKLNDFFTLSKYSKKGWKWHHLVRLVFEPPEIKQHMYDRLQSLILKHRRSLDSYFEIKTDEGTYNIPNPLAELNKLEVLYVEYFAIYKNIIDKIHFDYPKIEKSSLSMRGKINWTHTLRKSHAEFPLKFSTSDMKKNFDTPENILLILCARWIYVDSTRLLNIQFKEPLSDDKTDLLTNLSQKTRSILNNFPINEILNASKRYWNLSNDDYRIINLENETHQRIKHGYVNNKNYSLLLNWIEKFRQLNLSRISEKTPSRHIIEPIENIDTIFELWIFMEFIEYLDNRGILIDFKLDIEEPYCKFEHEGIVVTLWYEKKFMIGHHAWIVEHSPDFTAMVDDDIIAVFDAKNYSKSDSFSESKNKMLSYMINLDTNFGGLIYPHHPEYWDDLNPVQRKQTIRSNASYQNLKGRNDIDKIINKLIILSWKELPTEYQDICPPINIKRYCYPFLGRSSRYHHDQTLCLIRMSPEYNEQAISIKEKSLESIFKEIVSRIVINSKSR